MTYIHWNLKKWNYVKLLHISKCNKRFVVVSSKRNLLSRGISHSFCELIIWIQTTRTIQNTICIAGWLDNPENFPYRQ